MVKMSDLIHRDYVNKICVGFTYILFDESNNKEKLFEARWTKTGEENGWNMNVVLDRTSEADSQVYNLGYVMPRGNLPLTLIAATGLKYFQLYLKNEIQQKQMIDFSLGNELEISGIKTMRLEDLDESGMLE